MSDVVEPEELDSEGKPAPYRAPDRVVVLQVPCVGVTGEIVRQRLHSDGCQTFWGNCIVKLDNGQVVQLNCWQLDREEGWKQRYDAKEAARLAEKEARDRAELARLKAKYEPWSLQQSVVAAFLSFGC